MRKSLTGWFEGEVTIVIEGWGLFESSLGLAQVASASPPKSNDFEAEATLTASNLRCFGWKPYSLANPIEFLWVKRVSQ